MWRLFLIVALLSGFMMFTMAGCSDDDVTKPEDNDDPVVLPTDPDALMAGFSMSYDDLDLELLAALIHPDFKGFLTSSTLAEWQYAGAPLPFTFFERDTVMAIHENIFTGETGRRPSGDTVSPVNSIEVDLLTRLTSWTPISAGDENFGGLEGYWALFHLNISFYLPDGSRFSVQQDIEFYVVPVEIDGVLGYQLLGWREIEPNGGLKATESASLGGVLSLYR
jgi:hypothetical protein